MSPPGEVGHLLRGHLVGIVQNRHALRQTVIGMITGSCLAEHENPGEATILILHGRVRLSTADLSWDGARGDLLIIPDGRHGVETLEDSAVLRTVVRLA